MAHGREPIRQTQAPQHVITSRSPSTPAAQRWQRATPGVETRVTSAVALIAELPTILLPPLLLHVPTPSTTASPRLRVPPCGRANRLLSCVATSPQAEHTQEACLA